LQFSLQAASPEASGYTLVNDEFERLGKKAVMTNCKVLSQRVYVMTEGNTRVLSHKKKKSLLNEIRTRDF
jgi:hypothetical protein